MISGSKKVAQEQVSIKNSVTGEMMVTEKDIKKASLEYCQAVLKTREAGDEFVKEVATINRLHDLRMKEENDDTETDDTITFDDFVRILERFKSKGKKSYHFLTKSGSELLAFAALKIALFCPLLRF